MDTLKNLISKIPKEVSRITDTLEKAGFEAYLVGGCVRDLLMDREPKDWDITTNAKPEQIIGLFEKTIYENNFGTVGVVVTRETYPNNVARETLEVENSESNFIVEVTPFRIETKYSDFRHPDEVKFSDRLEDDLKRRDFTINAMALKDTKEICITDMFGGLKDIKDRVLRSVGNPDERFQEDALRMLRAVRLALQLDFSVSHETSQSICQNAYLLKEISAERIRDELLKIIMLSNPSVGIAMLQKFGLLRNIMPELEEGIGCEQAGEHIYDVWNHSLHALQHSADKNWPLEVRLAALFHDIGKPRSRRPVLDRHGEPQDSSQAHFLKLSQADGMKMKLLSFSSDSERNRCCELLRASDRARMSEKSADFYATVQKVVPRKNLAASRRKYTFYGHEVIGGKMAKKIMERLKFPKKESELAEKLIRNHMFFSDTELITLSAVRRIIAKVGAENIWLLMNVRECDRVGMKKKEAPYRLRKYFAMIEEALRDPISVGQLKINGEFMIKELEIPPGPRMGWILHALLEEILDDPAKNTVEHLSELAKSLNMLGDAELKALGERGKEKKEELEGQEVEKLHSKHGVS